MGIFDDLDNPLPDAPASDSEPARQARLPLRAELLVEDRKYAGERIDREDAEIAEVDSDDEEPGEFDHVLFDNSDTDDGDNDVEDIDGENEESEEDQGDARSKVYGKISQVNEQYLMDETGNGVTSDLKELEAREEEKKFAERLAEERSKEIKRAKAIHAQKAAYDSVVDFRIRVEQVLTVARGFPTRAQREESADWKSLNSSGAENMELAKTAEASLDELIELTRSALIKMCPSNIDATSEESFCNWQDAVLDKWGKKVDESEGIVPKGGFKAIDSSASGQLRATLTTGKHVQRAQRVRVAVPLHGNAGEIHVGTSDIHYEDKELYRSLLQEVIESGEGTGGGLRYARLTKSGKVKKKIDRRASKARKLRYIVHEKLVGFLAPLPLPPPGPIDEIIASIFGGANKVSSLQSR